MKYKVGDLLITKVDDIDITLKDNRYEFSKKNKLHLSKLPSKSDEKYFQSFSDDSIISL